MRGRFWTALGVLLTLAMIGLSAAINYTFGYSLGTTETNARILGGVSVVAVGVMAVLPLRISARWTEGSKGKAVLGAGVFVILMAYAIASSIGLGMQNRSQLAGSRESLNAQLDDNVQERDQALARLNGLGDYRPASSVSAEIAAARKDRRWDATRGCTNATALTSREFCQGLDRLEAELGMAATAAVLGEKVEKLNFSIAKLRKQGAGQIADPQSFGFAVLFGVEQDRVRIGLSMLLALVIESVCCFGLLVIVGGHPGAVAAAKVTLPEWIGTWLAERAEPHSATRISFSELEEDFRGWCNSRGAPHLGSWRFKRLLRAACREVGLSIEGRMVLGMRLARGLRLLNMLV
jgi:hypothetical protein